MPLFDRDELLALGANTPALTTTLSGNTIALILACTGLLENRDEWSEMTDAEWDEIEAIVASVIFEVTP